MERQSSTDVVRVHEDLEGEKDVETEGSPAPHYEHRILREKVLASLILITITGGIGTAVGRGDTSARAAVTPVTFPLNQQTAERFAPPVTARQGTAATTRPAVSNSTKATVDALLGRVVAASSVWEGARFKSPLDRAAVAKAVLDNLRPTYEAIARLPSDVPSPTSKAASTEAIHLWTRIWSEFECIRVEARYTSDQTGCKAKGLYPDTVTIAMDVIDLLAEYSDLSASAWVAEL